MQYTQHPLSAAFPTMSEEDFQALKESIDLIGVRNPITLLDGMVLDGWHRYQAATQMGMDCPTVELDGWIDARQFVLAQNKARRHITQAQLAMATAAVYDWFPVGNPDLPQSAQKIGNFQSGTQCPIGKTNAELAQIAGVGERTIKQAKVVHANAVPEVQDAVKRGDIGLVKAAAIAKLPAEQQAAAINKPLPKRAPSAEASSAWPADQALDDDDRFSPEDFLAQYNEVEAENNQLRERVAALIVDDKTAEIDKLITRIDGLEGRLRVAMAQAYDSEKTTKVHASVIHKLRKMLGVERHSEIIESVRRLLEGRSHG